MSNPPINTHFTERGYMNPPGYPSTNVGDFLTQLQTIQQNYNTVTDPCGTIFTQYYANRAAVLANPIYDYSGNSLRIQGKTEPTIRDGVAEDNRLMMLQENSVYIIGCISMATFLIVALIIGSE